MENHSRAAYGRCGGHQIVFRVGDDAGNVVGEARLGFIVKSNFGKPVAFHPGKQGWHFVPWALVLVGYVDFAGMVNVQMPKALLMVARIQAADNLSRATVHKNQRWGHGVEIELEPVIIRVGENAAQSNGEGFTVRM